METKFQRYNWLEWRESRDECWKDVEVKDIKKGDVFQILVDGVSIIKESGSCAFIAHSDAFFDFDDKEWRVSVKE